MRGVAHSAALGLMAGVTLLTYAFPYVFLPSTWWRAIPSTAAILLIVGLVVRERTLRFVGLSLTTRPLLISMLMLVVGAFAANKAIRAIADAGPLVAHADHSLLGAVHQFFQVLNDEMILRAALLTLVLRVLPHPKTAVFGCALLFSVAHHVVYRLHGVHVGGPALLSLFSFGLLANLLFIRLGHVGYCVALHGAWNLPRFGYLYSVDGRLLSEGMTFNYIEGNPWIVVVSISAAAGAFVFHVWKPPASSATPVVLVNAAQRGDASE